MNAPKFGAVQIWTLLFQWPAERADLTARRKVIYERMHPETVREASLKQNSSSRQRGETERADRFTADTARATGQSERKVHTNSSPSGRSLT